MQVNPNSIDDFLAKKITFLYPSAPKKVLLLCFGYAKRYDYCDDPFILLDHLLRKWRTAVEVGDGFIKIFKYLCDHYKEYRQNRVSACAKYIHNIVIGTRHIDTIVLGYDFLAAYPTAFSDYDFPKIMRHLRHEDTANAALGFLAVVGPTVTAQDDMSTIVSGLLNAANSNRRAMHVLCKVCASPIARAIIMKDLSILTTPRPNHKSTLHLFQCLTEDATLLPPIIDSPHVPVMFANCLNEDASLVEPLAIELVNLQGMTQTFIERLDNSGFCQVLYRLLSRTRDLRFIRMGFKVFTTIADVGYIKSLTGVAKTAYNLIVADQVQGIDNSCLSLIYRLSRYDEVMPVIARMDLTGLESKFVPAIEKRLNTWKKQRSKH